MTPKDCQVIADALRGVLLNCDTDDERVIANNATIVLADVCAERCDGFNNKEFLDLAGFPDDEEATADAPRG